MSVSTQTYERVIYDGLHCRLVVQQVAEQVVVVRIAGTDIGEFGNGPFTALNRIVTNASNGPDNLFIDARDVRGASLDVSGAWAKWLDGHGGHLKRVHMLARSRLISLTAEFVRRFARLEGKMTIVSSDEEFDLALGRAMRATGA